MPACSLMQYYSAVRPINVGCGEDLSILELARLIAQVVGFTGRFELDPTRPDGTPRKVLDVSRLTALGWRARIDFASGIKITHDWYRRNLVRAPAFIAGSFVGSSRR